MIKRTLALSLLLVATLVVVAISSLKVDEKSQNFVVSQVVKHGVDGNGGGWFSLIDANGGLLIMDRGELADSDEAWRRLESGQTVVLKHYLEYWRMFGKVITKKHIDKLTIVPAP